jgi:NAD(P)-dependent dehydrogenase (short-subunit alcohol dehydrogenase family)
MHPRTLFDLSGKVALVTGGSRGLGLQMAQALGEMGAKVAISARKADELKEAEAGLRQAGIDCLAVVNDLTQTEQIPVMIDAVLERFGTLDILVNNAGASWGAPAEDYPTEAWHKVMNLNVNAMFFLCQYVGKNIFIPKQSGKIINIASIAGLAGNPPGIETIAYNTSKGADINFTRALAAEWGRYNINVNAICPGFFPTKMSSGLLEKISPQVLARTPLQRLGGEDDLKGTVIFLASDASRHITGQYITVDGGMSIS